MAAPEYEDFDYEFYAGVPHVDVDLRAEAERRLRELAAEHSDLIGASVSVEKQAQGESLPHLYRVRVVGFMRPSNVVAIEKDETIENALRGALAAIERKVREKREKLGEPWKRPDMRE